MSFKPVLVKLIHGWALMGGALLLGIVLATAINAAGFTGTAVARMWGGNVPGLPGYEDAVQMLVGVAALAMFPYAQLYNCLLYTSPSPRDKRQSRMPSSA